MSDNIFENGDDFDTEYDEEEYDEEEDDDESKVDVTIASDDEDDSNDDIDNFEIMITNKSKNNFRTKNCLTKYEFAAIVGYRAQQIAEGARPYVEVGKLIDPSLIAIKEINEGKCPLTIDRPLPSHRVGVYDYETRTLDELIHAIPIV